MNINKKITIFLLMNLVILLIFTTFVEADTYDVRDSVHNLSATGSGDIKSFEADNYCLYCHTPHDAAPIEPLWNHTMSKESYTLYDSSTIDATDIDQPNDSSTLCLSCHDGTIAMGDVVNIRSVGNEMITDSGTGKLGDLETFSDTAKANLGVNITDDHPISFVYDNILAESDGELEDPNIASSGLGDTIKNDMLGDNSRLQCASCHNPHNNTYGDFLIKDNTGGDLCTTCHNKTGWTTGNAHYDVGVTCNDCHTPHSAAQSAGLKASTEEQLCYTCHDDSGNRYDEWTSVVDIGSVIDNVNNNGGSTHPIEDSNLASRHYALENNEPSTELPVAAVNKHSECSDCHDPHQVTLSNPLKGIPGFDLSGTLITSVTNSYELCYKCHQGANGLQESIDSVKYTFDNRTSTHGNGTNAEKCTKCHGGNSEDISGEAVHGSNEDGLLTEPQFVNVDSPSTSDLCVSCHDNSTASEGPPKIYFINATGSQHNTKCTACHGDSVNYNSNINYGSETGVPHGSNVSQLLKSTQPEVCVDCHSSRSDMNSGHPMNITNDGSVYPQIVRPITWTSGCQACHTQDGASSPAPHGTDYTNLLMMSIDPTNGTCDDCHDMPGGIHSKGSHWQYSNCTNCHIEQPHITDGVGYSHKVVEVADGFNNSEITSYSKTTTNYSCDATCHMKNPRTYSP
ncbi:cytochrome c3 family protein [Selenihalanaerobacter shriftii]|nr:cytochrome c3 family protein [Selenihalanaerobacter shriftii]